MAFSVANSTSYVTDTLKLASATFAAATELRMANLIQTEITSFHRWHWAIAAATDIAVTSSNQDYSMDSGDQNKVLAITEANLLEGLTEQPDLLVWSDSPVPKTSTTGQPLGVSLISPTKIRLWPFPDASYTFQWQYYARPVIFTSNSNNWDIPEAFTDVVKVGMLWQGGEFQDDVRAPEWKKDFFSLLANHKRVELMTVGRRRL